MDREFKVSPSLIALVAGSVLGVVFLIATVFSTFVQVESGHVGVVTTFGAISKEPLAEGLHLVIPWVQKVHQCEVRIKTFEVKRSSAASHDIQQVHTIVSVQHYIQPAMAPEAFQAIGDLEKFDEVVVNPSVMEAIKAVTAQYTAEELVTKRDLVKDKMVHAIQENIDKTLSAKNIKGALRIDNVAIKETEFSKAFNDSVEAKVKAGQLVLRAHNEKTKKITEAEGTKKNKMLGADAEAYQITERSKANAAAIEREIKSLAQNPSLLELRLIERWDGRLPTFSSPGQSLRPADILKIHPSTEAQSAK